MIALLPNITPAMCRAVTPRPAAIWGKKNLSASFSRGGSSRFSFGSSARTSGSAKGHLPMSRFTLVTRINLHDHRRRRPG